jgi:protein STE50
VRVPGHFAQWARVADSATENEIVGEALIALRHEELKEMGVSSVGHRLTILKGVYDVKVKQDVPIESDHYIPLCEGKNLLPSCETRADHAKPPTLATTRRRRRKRTFPASYNP